jgi:hypothetical protein
MKNREGRYNKAQTYKAMVLILHAKERVKIHAAKLLTKTICKAKTIKKKHRKKQKTFGGGQNTNLRPRNEPRARHQSNL